MVRVVMGMEECYISIHRYGSSSLLAPLPLHLVSSFLTFFFTLLCQKKKNFFPLLGGKVTHTLFEFVYFIRQPYVLYLSICTRVKLEI